MAKNRDELFRRRRQRQRYKLRQTAKGRLILCNIDPQIHEVFEITKLDKLVAFGHPLPPSPQGN